MGLSRAKPFSFRRSRYDTTVLSKAHIDELVTELSGRIVDRSSAMDWCRASDAIREVINNFKKREA